MFFFRSKASRRSADLQHGVLLGADKLMAACGVHAYEEARRRRFEARSAAAARYWLRVKAEIGRRLVDGCGDAVHFDRLEAKLESFDPMFGLRGGGREGPANESSTGTCGESLAKHERRELRRQAEADMRAAMRKGDLDGVRTALRRMEPRVFALS